MAFTMMGNYTSTKGFTMLISYKFGKGLTDTTQVADRQHVHAASTAHREEGADPSARRGGPPPSRSKLAPEERKTTKKHQRHFY